MKFEIEYKAPELLELDVSVCKGGDGEYGNVSNAKFESCRDEEEHETFEL